MYSYLYSESIFYGTHVIPYDMGIIMWLHKSLNILIMYIHRLFSRWYDCMYYRIVAGCNHSLLQHQLIITTLHKWPLFMAISYLTCFLNCCIMSKSSRSSLSWCVHILRYFIQCIMHKISQLHHTFWCQDYSNGHQSDIFMLCVSKN